jgi:hypothetical protein
MLTKLEEFVGRTIGAAVFEDATVYLRFTDGTLGGFHSRYRYEDLEIEVAEDEPYDHTQLALGIIDQIEYDRRKATKDKEWEDRQAANERAQYERLKAKFEPPNS